MRRLARLFAELPPTENANAASPSTLCGRLRAPISDRACPILFTGQRSKPSPFVRFSLSIIPRSVSCPIFLSTRKNSFVALTKVSSEKRYFDCESFFSFSFFSPFFLRSFLRSFNEHYLLNYRENRTTLESLVRTENEINAAFLERKYPGFEVIVSSKTNIRKEPVLRDLLFSFFFFFYSFFSLYLSPPTVYSAMNFEARRNDVARESSLPLVTMGYNDETKYRRAK